MTLYRPPCDTSAVLRVLAGVVADEPRPQHRLHFTAAGPGLVAVFPPGRDPAASLLVLMDWAAQNIAAGAVERVITG